MAELDKGLFRRIRLAVLLLVLVITGFLAMSKHLGQGVGIAGTWNEGMEASMTNRTEREWETCLTPEQYQILRKKGTERAFTGRYYDYHGTGTYVCAACRSEIFRSDEKYDSGTGWPSFWKPVSNDAVLEKPDGALGMTRTEVVCSKCGGHLGHVFDDGPAPTGQRYCINSAALDFKSAGVDAAPPTGLELATFGAGCFWCTEAVFERLNGVKSVKAGYMGGTKANPTYEEVCSGKSGHAEVAQIEFDPKVISFAELVNVFWKTHDPTSLNRQGADTGPQYRSSIFYHSEAQRETAEKSKAEYGKNLEKPVVTEIVPADTFYEAEDYHQDYYRRNQGDPYCRMVIAPKLKKLK